MSLIVYCAAGNSLDRLPVQASNFDEATLKTGHGVYTVFRLYPGRRVLRLDHHLARLRQSAELLSAPYALSDDWLRSALHRAVEAAGMDMPRIRLTIPFADLSTAIIALEPFVPPPAAWYEQGVSVGLVEGCRESPRAKNSQFIEWRTQVRRNQLPEFHEVVMYNGDRFLREGLSSNFYAVLDGALHTAGEGVLEGISRSILLEVAPQILPVVLEPVHKDDLPALSEAMITSASRGIIPVVQVGDVCIGTGKPGSLAQALRMAYEAQVERELEPL
jgi:branched-chain amino acid aminotransferase